MRLGSDLAQLLFGLAAATITARWLGPADKGTLSVLLLISVLISYGSSLGFGDASVILRGQRRFELREAAESMVLPIGVATLFGVGLLWIAAYAADWSAIRSAVAVATIALPFSVAAYVLNALHNGQERLFLTSSVAAAASAVSLLGYVVLVMILDLGILGGTIAAASGSLGASILLFRALHRNGEFHRPRWNLPFLRAGLKYGLIAESAYLLVALSQRLDALLVYGIRGEGDAGRYSMALTFSQLVWYGSFALAAAGFPRLARLPEDEADLLTVRIARVSLLASALSAVVLIPITPLLVHVFLGSGFEGAITPTVILILGGIIWSQQWVLARAAVARGGVRLYLLSFAVSVLVMTLLDLSLVQRFGLVGAAWASAAASCAGLSVCLAYHVRRSGWSYLKRLIPSGRDVRELVASVRALLISSSGNA